MKISISGPQCCGKTTTMNALKELRSLNHYTFIEEPVRRLVKEKGIKINKDSTFEDQILILQEHHLNTLRYDDFVTDRSALDAFTYATYDYIVGKYSFSQWKQCKEIYEECINQYDRIFLLEPLPMKDDGFRSLDIDWQKKTYSLMHDIAFKHNNKPIILPDWSVELRMKIFEAAL
jgi:nicotinamide riboside kinase